MGNMFCWETLGICRDVPLIQNTNLNIAADQVHFFMEIWKCKCKCVFQQDHELFQTANITQEWFEEHPKEFKVKPWLLSSPDPNLIRNLWDMLDIPVLSMEVPPQLFIGEQIPQHTFTDLLESMPHTVLTTTIFCCSEV